MQDKYNFLPYRQDKRSPEEMAKRSLQLKSFMETRRTIRDYSSESFPIEVLENCIMTASTAPSGANKQPWTFCIVTDPTLKKKIRESAEKEEHENYNGRMGKEWLEDLAPLGTDENKPFLDTAPYLVVIFKRAYELIDGKKQKNYYVNESVGLAAGMFLQAVHHAGLVSLTHTPSPMNFLSDLLKRPANERAFLLIPVGFPAEDAKVPEITKKTITDVISYY